MRLLALRLRNFRRFEEAEYRFDPGLNVLVGPNEAGKSTLRQAILAAFFVNPATTAKRREEWRPWGSDRLGSVSLEFELEGRRFDLRKDFERRHTDLRDLLNGLSWEGSKVQERLQQALGLSTEPLYRATAMIEQAEITNLHAGPHDTFGNRLSRVIQVGPGDTEAGTVIKKLEKELAELEKGLDKPAKTPGTIRGLQEEVSALTRERDTLRHRVEVLESKRDELKRVHVEGRHAAADLTDREELLRENQKMLAIERELEPMRAEARQLAERVAAVEQRYDRLEAIGRDLEVLLANGVPDDEAVARIHAAAGRVQQQDKTVDELTRGVRKTEADTERLRSSPAASRGRAAALQFAAWFLIVLAGAAIAAAGAGPFGGLMKVAAAPLGSVGLLLLALDLRRRRHHEAMRRDRDGALMRLEETRRNLIVAEEELTAARTALQNAVTETGSTSKEQALSRHEHLRQLEAERARIQSQLVAYLGEEMLEGLREARDRRRADVAGREIQLTQPEAQAKRMTPLEVQQLERAVKDLTQSVHTLRARQDHLERETAEGGPDDEALAATEERLAERQEALEAARRRDRVVRLALEVLKAARQQTLIPARQRVEERAGEYLAILTQGAYGRVRIAEPPLQVTVWVEAAGQWVEPAEPALSRGTADQVYLAVRLALVEVLSEGRRPPLLLDDPFGSFDSERLAAAMALLRRMSETYQVLLFTCRPEYEPFADLVIPVDAAAAPSPELPGPLWQPPPPTH